VRETDEECVAVSDLQLLNEPWATPDKGEVVINTDRVVRFDGLDDLVSSMEGVFKSFEGEEEEVKVVVRVGLMRDLVGSEEKETREAVTLGVEDEEEQPDSLGDGLGLLRLVVGEAEGDAVDCFELMGVREVEADCETKPEVEEGSTDLEAKD